MLQQSAASKVFSLSALLLLTPTAVSLVSASPLMPLTRALETPPAGSRWCNSTDWCMLGHVSSVHDLLTYTH